MLVVYLKIKKNFTHRVREHSRGPTRLLCACACSLNKNKKKYTQGGDKVRGAPAGVLCRSASKEVMRCVVARGAR